MSARGLFPVNYTGTDDAASIADNTASDSITGPNARLTPNYAFTLAQEQSSAEAGLR